MKDLKEAKPKTSKSPNQNPKSSGGCIFCKKPHDLEKCFKFKNLEAEDRVEFGKKERMCFNCLKTGHLSVNCRAYPNCVISGCKLKHHSLFHHVPARGSHPQNAEAGPTSVPSPPSSTGGTGSTGAGGPSGAGAVIRSAHILLNPNPISLGILPVRIKAKGGKQSVEGYAFLDNGSTGTVFLESLVDQLGAEATPTILNCETMNAKTSEECVTLDLRIESLDGSGYVECTGFSRRDLSVGNKSIPTKEQVQRFSHLRKIDFTELSDKKVRILIGIDVPEAHCPLEVLRGARKEPYALKSILGWTIHGPLGRTSPGVASFFHIQTSTQHPDDALDEDIQRMFRMDFSDHEARNLDLSIEDKYAVKVIKESTIHLPDGHYQVAMPFKPGGDKVLDSHASESYQGSLSRLKWLKKRFQQDPELFEKYTAKIRKLQDSGYSRTVVDPEKDKGWFLPHFPAFHPQKPGDVRVVKDGAARFGGTSLNDQLLQGPDVNNTLVGVLTRFREGEIGVVADVEGMFHQVKVAPHHTKYLKFLWFQNDNLNGPIEVREMLVNIFGARPSPTISNVTFRKTAEDNRNDYSVEVVKAVY